MTAGPRCTLSRILSTAIIAGIVAASAAPGQAQGPQRRRGGPRDWSQGRLVATRFGPDGDGSIGRNWRTRLKHHQIETARGSAAHRGRFSMPSSKRLENASGRAGFRRATPGWTGAISPHWRHRFWHRLPPQNTTSTSTLPTAATSSTSPLITNGQRHRSPNVIAITHPRQTVLGCPGNPAEPHAHREVCAAVLPDGVAPAPCPMLEPRR